jgi:import inner membrane translocase subunit TIM23
MEQSNEQQPILPPKGYATSFWDTISQPVTIQDAVLDRRRPYNPTSAFSIFNPLATPDKIEYLFQDDYKKYTQKKFGEQLMYNSGTLYLSGLALGGAWGFLEGLRNSPGNSFKLRLNSVLNSCTRRGPFLANSLGILSIMYVGGERSLATLRDKYDALNSIGAATIAGMLFKSTAGLRAIGFSGLIGGGGMMLYQTTKAIRENGLQIFDVRNVIYKLKNDIR